jgi:DNA-binding CsgD family transcriptional regulator
MQRNAFIDILDRVAGKETPESAWQSAIEVFSKLGFDWVTFGCCTTNCGPAIRTSVSSSLMADYAAAGLFEQDAWLKHCARSNRINEFAIGSASPSDVGYPVQEVLESHGIMHATLIPCSQMSKAAGIVVYARDTDSAAKLTSNEGIADLRLVVAVVSSIFRPTMSAPNAPGSYGDIRHLSSREADALRWLSLGLSTEAIALKMNLAPVTVTKHLAAARRRLNAKTREQALTIALMRGLIGL